LLLATYYAAADNSRSVRSIEKERSKSQIVKVCRVSAFVYSAWASPFQLDEALEIEIQVASVPEPPSMNRLSQ
jgi:hypothetical protein